MKRTIAGSILIFLVASAIADHHENGDSEAADEAKQKAIAIRAIQASAKPGDAHARLAHSVGEFTAEVKMFRGPGLEPVLTQMNIERYMEFGGRVLVGRWSGNYLGVPHEALIRTGFDNATRRYWSTRTDSLATGLLVVYGVWNKSQQAMLFEGEGVNELTAQTYKIRTVGTYPAPGLEVVNVYYDYGRGEYRSMEITFTRK